MPIYGLINPVLFVTAIGCPDIALDNSWVERHGNVMTWGCEGSSKAWRLTCEGGKWVGQRHNCTAAGIKLYIHYTNII